MPQLFARIPFGQAFMVLFFLALAFAAFTSLIAMIELATRVLLDAGVERSRAIKLVGTVGFALGLPSAVSLRVLHNQDWVWGVALMVSGLFFAIAVIVNGVERFRREQLNHEHSDIRVGKWWDVVVVVLVPLQAGILLVWWLWQARGWNPTGWLNPLGEDSVGTILLQWGLVLVGLIAANRWLARHSHGGSPG
jgi:NSS family neurotransmitter:Na+ symporter